MKIPQYSPIALALLSMLKRIRVHAVPLGPEYAHLRVTIVLAAIAIFSLWLRMGYPALGVWASYDDLHYIRVAEQLASGNWLGPYDPVVLAKGAFFPIFIFVSKVIGVPLKIAEHLCLLGVSLFAAATVARLTDSMRLLVPTFLVLAVSPTPWLLESARVVRDPIYQSLSLATLCLAARYLLIRRQILLGRVLGVVGACFWLTREEGVWLLPALGVLAMPWFVQLFRQRRDGALCSMKEPVLRLLSPVLIFLCVVALVNLGNLVEYRVFRNNDFRSGPFPEAYGALARIRSGEWKRYVVFPRESRVWAYSQSPAARELEPYLEGEGGRNWVKSNQSHPKPWGCADDPAACTNEIPSWLFVWALRDAVASAGHYRSAADADAYYARLAGEINAACASNAIPCRESRASLAPVWRGHYFRDTLRASGSVLLTLIHLNRGHIGVPVSPLTSEQALVFNSAINSPVSGFDIEGKQAVTEIPPADDIRTHLARGIAALYANVSPALAILALASYLFLLFAWSRVKSARVSGNSIMVLTALAVAICSRVCLLGFLEATSIPSNNLLYLLPAVPLYLMFIVVSTGLGTAALVNIARGARLPACQQPPEVK